MKKKSKIILLVIIVLGLGLSLIGGKLYLNYIENKELEEKKQLEEKQKEIKEKVEKHYNEYVKTTKETKIYSLANNEYIEAGIIASDVNLTLDKIEIDHNTKYFKISNLGNKYYVNYEDVLPSEKLEYEKRYTNYIPFDQTAITKESTKLYQDGKVIFSLQEGMEKPIYIIDGDKYYVEYENELYYLLKSEISELKKNVNSNKTKATNISTIVYHFIYDPSKGEKCDQVICHTISQVQSHIDYLKNNNYFSLTMSEFEMWIDGKLNLPKKSIVITIDDGWFGNNAANIFTENKVNATLFVITNAYEAKYYKTEYLETHSHGYNLHRSACPGMGSQGGAILCLPTDDIVSDLKLSSEKTFGSTVFAYPFYDYNDHAINALKKAGFTMAFGGMYANGSYNMKIGADKYRIPRITFLSTATVQTLKDVLATN